MIEVTLKNFQAHANTSFQLKGGFACVVGPTNAGKSSVVRAIRWALYDNLRGSRYVRHGQQEARVCLKFDNSEVERIKGKSTNSYRVNDTTFDNIGVTNLPEVGKATNIPLVRVDKDVELELNVSVQLKSPFMVMETDSAKAKCLNVLTGGHVIDAGIRETNRRIRELEDRSKTTQTTIDNYKTQLAAFPDLQRLEQKIAELQKDYDNYIAMDNKLTLAARIKNSLAKLRNARLCAESFLNKIIPAKADIESDLNKLELMERQLVLFERLRSIRVKRIEAEHTKIRVLNELNECKKQLQALPEQACEACGQLISKDAIEKHLHELTSI